MTHNFDRVLTILNEGTSLPSIIKQILSMESTVKRHNRRVLNVPDEPSPNFDPSEYFIKYAKKCNPKIKDYNMPMKQCYTNAAKVSIRYNKQYMEGWVIVHGVPLRHAWIKDEEVTLKDNTDNEYYGIKIPHEVVHMAVTHVIQLAREIQVDANLP